jgi:phenylalanyl-tRNA synthetase beta chain
MKISYNWLQSFFDQKLPDPKEVAERLTSHSFEVEGLEQLSGGDAIFDIDVLPNRAHDCLSHYGIAREIAALWEIPLARDPLRAALPSWPSAERLAVFVSDENFCPRYSALLIENVQVGPSPDWLVERLAALGQRSINNIVDATNYVMLSIGQPLHAFDFKKLTITAGAASIGVRPARAGEKIVTLDEAERALPEGTLLVVDGGSDTAIAIAGIKGGMATAIDAHTEHIVLESANFAPVSTRKSAQALGLRTDASTRFEHAISAELTLHALREAATLIGDIAGGKTVVGGLTDVYPTPEVPRMVEFSAVQTNNLLGTAFATADIAKLLERLGFRHEIDATKDSIIVTTPFERLDIAISEDVIEEVGRVAGYGSIEATALPKPDKATTINKRAYYMETTRDFFVERGFSEVYTYAFTGEGNIALANPIASDKGFLRPNLTSGLEKALELNVRNADLLGLDAIRMFEIGTVFRTEGERVVLGIGLRYAGGDKRQKGVDAELGQIVAELAELLGANIAAAPINGIVEIDLDAFVAALPEPKSYTWLEQPKTTPRYKRPSAYPFVLRDIAVWVPEDVSTDDIIAIITEKAGELLVEHRLFDEYHKDGRISYAFRLVFQSKEKTLTDDEVGLIMWQITAVLQEREGWEVR